jgi:AcrR family transcriptional regulator
MHADLHNCTSTTDRSVAQDLVTSKEPPLKRPRRAGQSRTTGARERVVSTAYDLFCRYGVQSVGIDRIIDEAGVAKTTLYRHFRSKDELVLAVLELREKLWSQEWLEASVRRRVRTPEKRLLVIFDLFHEWFQLDDYEGCFFMNTILETHDPASPVRTDSERRLANIHSFLRDLGKEAGIRRADDFAHHWQQLLLGAITAASKGDRQAARRARTMASLFLERELTKA